MPAPDASFRPPATPRRSRDLGRTARRRRDRRLPRLGPGPDRTRTGGPAAGRLEGHAPASPTRWRPDHEGGRHRRPRRPLRRRSRRPRGLRKNLAGEKISDILPISARRFEKPVKEYKAYAHGWIERTIVDAKALGGALAGGSRADARQAWEKAWGDYMHLGADYADSSAISKKNSTAPRAARGLALESRLRQLPPAGMGALDRPPLSSSRLLYDTPPQSSPTSKRCARRSPGSRSMAPSTTRPAATRSSRTPSATC